MAIAPRVDRSGGGMDGRQGKRFFFAKKNQKTLIHWLRPRHGKDGVNGWKFCFLFQKETLAPRRHAAP
jgi:hypothetical protein